MHIHTGRWTRWDRENHAQKGRKITITVPCSVPWWSVVDLSQPILSVVKNCFITSKYRTTNTWSVANNWFSCLNHEHSCDERLKGNLFLKKKKKISYQFLWLTQCQWQFLYIFRLQRLFPAKARHHTIKSSKNMHHETWGSTHTERMPKPRCIQW